MPKFTIPKQPVIPTAPGIGITEAASAITAATSIGNLQQDLGQKITMVGQQYFDEAKNSIEDSIVNSAYSKALIEFNQKAEERISQVQDENGVPQWESLSTDLAQIGQDIDNKFGTSIISPRARAKFAKRMQELRTTKTLAAMQEARTQERSFNQVSRLEAIEALQTQALTARPGEADSYISQMETILAEGVASGDLDPVATFEAKNQLRANLLVARYTLGAKSDPYGTLKEIKSQSPESLKINALQYANLVETVEAAVDSHEKQLKLQENAVLAKQEQQQKEAHSDIWTKINDSTIAVSKDDIAASYAEGRITLLQKNDLLRKWEEKYGKELQNVETIKNIAQDIKAGRALSTAKYSPKDLDMYLRDYISEKERIKGEHRGLASAPLSPKELGQALIDWKAPAPYVMKRLTNVIRQSTDPQEVLQSVKVLDDLAANNHEAVSAGVTEKDWDLVAAVIHGAAEGGANIAEVVRQERDRLLNPLTDKTQDILGKEFDTMVREAGGHKEALKDALSSWYNIGPFAVQIDPTQVADLAATYRSAYIRQGGDASKAAKSVQMMEGARKKMGEIGFGKKSGNIMAYEPSKTIRGPENTTYSSKEIKTVFSRKLQEVAKDNPRFPTKKVQVQPEGPGLIRTETAPYDINDFEVITLPGTRASAVHVEGQGTNPIYGLKYTDPVDGLDKTLVGPDNRIIEIEFTGSDHEFLINERAKLAEEYKQAGERRAIITGGEPQPLTPLSGVPKSTREVSNILSGMGAGAESRAEEAVKVSKQPAASNLDVARTLLHKDERKHAKTIASFIEANGGGKINPAKTPWCAAFVNAVLGANGVKGTGSWMAKSFLKWGKPVDDSSGRAGDIIVFHRTSNPAHGHVAFIVRKETKNGVPGYVYLGGNQTTKDSGRRGVTVNEKWAPINKKIAGIRRGSQ